jgi:halocyanin-like protein
MSEARDSRSSAGDPSTDTRGGISRRTALRSLAGGAAGAAVATTAGTAAAQSQFDGWFDGVSNYDGVVDMTGQDEVTVEVGTEANGGNLAFGPAAIRITPGTTVTWEWTGEGGGHNVVAEDGTFSSGDDLVSEAGHTYSYTFESEGTHRYICVPHETIGMKGAVVVQAGGSGGGSGGGDPDYGDWFSDVSNYDGTTVDARGQEEVTVGVGTEGNGGNLAFDPPAVHVDSGTTVTWEWTGEGGGHNVVAEDGTFSSGEEFVSEAGYTYSYTFESDGLYRYVCVPHEGLGMKGAVVVGDDYPSTGGGGGGGGGAPVTRPPGATTGLAVFAAILFGALASPILVGWRLDRNRAVGAGAGGAGTAGESVQVTEAAVEEPAEAVEHDEFDPTGTLSLVLVYMGILAVMWVFMYFVEFLQNGPTVIG